ncbi:MAG: hypothetical protein AAFR61_13245 [Bacteroidota bacterium]
MGRDRLEASVTGLDWLVASGPGGDRLVAGDAGLDWLEASGAGDH